MLESGSECVNIGIQVDTSGLVAGINAAKKYSRRSITQIVNTSAYWIAVNAKNSMPYITPERVDKDLGVIVSTTVSVGKTGKVGRKTIRKATASGSITSAPLAALIINARANPQSYYNQRTARRWALGKSPFAGKSRKAGAAAMRAAVNKLVNVRHSAGKFLLAGWIPAIRALKSKALHKFSKGGPSPNEHADSYYGADLGAATPATESDVATAIIENLVGMEGKNAASYNAALLKYGGPGLQAAVDREGQQHMNYALKKMEAELAKETNKHWT